LHVSGTHRESTVKTFGPLETYYPTLSRTYHSRTVPTRMAAWFTVMPRAMHGL